MSTRLRAAAAAAAFVAVVPPILSLPGPLSSLLEADSQAQSQPGPAASAHAPTTTSVATSLQRLVTAEINVVRLAHRLPRPAVSAGLARAGREHAQRGIRR